MDKFRLLTPDDIEVKVKQVNEKGAVLLLYKTARTDMDILDETVGAENWQCEYADIKGNLYCSIGIRFPEGIGERWTFKSDCGIESREDDEGNQKKGEASDAFKRAGFKWGIGRELYTAPFIWIPAAKFTMANGPKPRTYDRFSVTQIEYTENRKIKTLAIRNETTGNDVFFWTSDTKLPQAPSAPAFTCAVCGAKIEAYVNPDTGRQVTPFLHAQGSNKRFGKVMCLECIKRHEATL